MSYVDCVVDDDYEILNEYPYTIRKKSTGHVVSESLRNGYYRVSLNHKDYNKHRIIALQFIQNNDPERKTEVDHIDTNGLNNHINNLRWCTPRQNNLNRSSNKGIEYEYVEEDDLPDDIIIVYDYGNRTIETDEITYYFSPSEDLFYLYNGIRYRVMYINYKKNGGAFVRMFDTNGKKVDVCYNKFKKLYDLI